MDKLSTGTMYNLYHDKIVSVKFICPFSYFQLIDIFDTICILVECDQWFCLCLIFDKYKKYY